MPDSTTHALIQICKLKTLSGRARDKKKYFALKNGDKKEVRASLKVSECVFSIS